MDANSSKLIVELNKSLNVKHQATTCQDKEISNPKILESTTCFLNFNEDRLEFEISVSEHRWKDLLIENKTVSYEKIDASTFAKSSLELPIVSDKTAEDSNYTIMNVVAGFKNVLLNLFSHHNKEFKLTIDYEFNSLEYQTIFFVTVPSIEQKDWYPRVSGTGIYMPEIVGGIELKKLFQKNFRLQIDSTANEAKLRCDLMDFADASIKQKFNDFNFLKMFQKMLAIEDLSSIKMMEDYSLTFQKVLHYSSSRISLRSTIDNHLKFLMCPRKMREFVKKTYIIEATKKMPCDAQEFDFVYLTDMQDYQQFHDDLHEIAEHRLTGKIQFIFGNLILIQLVQKQRNKRKQTFLEEDRPYHVEFLPNRVSIRVAHRAVEDAMKNQLHNYLKNFPASDNREGKKKIIDKFNWMNPTISGNKEQKAAIKNIVNCSSFPAPYCIFGPPGTGKSTTIIEAIAQIVKLKPRAHILVTAKSNSSCDDIGNRLLKYVSMNKILRIYSPAFDKKPERIDKNLEPISNFSNRVMCKCNKRSCPELMPCDDPTYEEFYTSRVIIATLVSCGRIVSAGIKSTHFDYIFIDEAASESEPYTLIPISGLGSSLKGVTAQIVLSGDHKQLGAIVLDRFCRRMGMEKSMMERIMETNPKYMKSSRYNPQFVTQLVQNYRSHPAILQFSNENFYDSKLIAKCPREIANFACGWDFLMNNKDFPLLFHTTRTSSTEVGTSLMNTGEVNLLDQYIRALLDLGIKDQPVGQSDIGVISPYRAQRDRIREQFEGEFPKIEIGTVDAFQGREKKIIIMSTVRSQTTHVGFLRNEKRLNVALTRAKCLLIIIGNSSTLQKCVIWNKFVGYCQQNRAIVGDALSLDVAVAADENFAGAEEKPEEIEDEYDQ